MYLGDPVAVWSSAETISGRTNQLLMARADRWCRIGECFKAWSIKPLPTMVKRSLSPHPITQANRPVVPLIPELQVWLLTQLYSVDFLQSWISGKKCVFNKRTIKVCVSWRLTVSLDLCAPSATHLTVSLYLCSSVSNARGESRALEGRCVSSKSLSRVRDGDEGVAGRNGRE